MAAVVALTKDIDPTRRGIILTFVVPAKHGCDLRCKMCFIAGRGEETRLPSLHPADYARFVREIAKARAVSAVTIQGHEPLLASAISMTISLLEAGRDCGSQTALVTNGQNLTESAGQLFEAGCGSVAISIDSSDSRVHDRLRGRSNAFARAVSGIKTALSMGFSPEQLSVASVLFPRRADYLTGMPELLSEIGLRRWAVSPALRFSDSGTCMLMGKPEETRDELAKLAIISRNAGVEFLAEDEFGVLNGTLESELMPFILRVFARPEGVVRLTPDGRCSVGRDIFRATHPDPATVWDATEDAAAFMERIFSMYDQDSGRG